MAKQLRFVYHPNTDKVIDKEQIRQAHYKVIEFLVEKALQKTAYK